MFKKMKLGTKIFVIIFVINIFVIFVLVTIVNFRSSKMQTEAILTSTENMAYRYGNEIDAILENSIDVARTLAQSFNGYKNIPITQRREYFGYQLKQVLEANPQLFGLYTCWEPNALDGMDNKFKNSEGHDETGRFVPYYNYANGLIALEPLKDYEKPGAGDYYLIAKQTGKESIIDPYFYVVGGKEFLMTSLIVPIMEGGKFIGMVGVDLLLDDLQKLTDTIKPYNVGTVSILSNNGAFITSPDSKAILITHQKYAPEEDKKFNVTENIKQGKSIFYENIDELTNKTTYNFIVPIKIGNSTDYWAAEIKIPETIIEAPINNLVMTIILVALFSIILMGIILFFITQNVSKTIKNVIKETQLLTVAAINGNLKVRGNSSNINHEFSPIINGINKTLDALITPLNMAADYVDKISKGEIPDKITDVYNGDFNTIKNNLNSMITTFTEVTQKIQKISVGDLDINFIKRSEKDSMLESLNNLIETQNLIVEKVKLISKGDLTLEIKERSEKDELLISLMQMIKALNYIVNEVKIAANYVATGSMEISSSSQQMSQGASEQASSIEEVSSSIEQMTANIMKNTENAKETELIAIKSAEDINKGYKSVRVTINAMKKIVSKILIIEDLAAKTDLLAINAAIEAARAGEHGKGFAVVANEVRTLAERSGLAAVEIKELSKSSILVAEKSGALLRDIVPQFEKTSTLVQEITSASVEQSSGVNQMYQAINQLNQIAQINAASSEEMATSSEELSSQAEQLNELIAFFKLTEDINLLKNTSKPNIKKINNVVTNYSPTFKKYTHENDFVDSKFEKF